MVPSSMLVAPRSWLRQLTLGQKLLATFGLLSFLLLLSLVAILFYLNRINSYVERHNRITIPAVLTAAEMREMVYQGNAVATATLEKRDVESSGAAQAQLKHVRAVILDALNLYRDVHAVQTHPILYSMLQRHGQGALASEEAVTLGEIGKLVERVSQGWTVLASLRTSSAAVTGPRTELEQESNRLIAAISRLLQLHAKIDAEMKVEGDHLLRQAELVILALVSLVGLVVVMAYRLATTEIAQPLRQLAHTADRVAHHDLSAEFQFWPAKDEVGTLAGSLRSMLAILRDRTYALERKTRGLESFTSSVAHDLKAPLREIEGFSSLLLRAASLDAQSPHYLQCIHAASLRMAGLIEALLRYARLERVSLPRQRVALRPLVEGLLAERLASWTVQLPRIMTDLPFADILAEPESLRQALGNLLDNALKFVPKDQVPELKIGGRMTPSERILWVQDNGIGFESRNSERIFGLFERLHTEDEYEGTGVGLAIVKLVMEKHGGRVWVESSPGKGSTFYLAFPDVVNRAA